MSRGIKIKCEECGSLMYESSQYCPNCGAYNIDYEDYNEIIDDVEEFDEIEDNWED